MTAFASMLLLAVAIKTMLFVNQIFALKSPRNQAAKKTNVTLKSACE